MGARDGEGYPEDGEGPRRNVMLSPFAISAYAVTNARFARFIEETGYRTDAEQLGWSFVFHLFLSPALKRTVRNVPPETPWWYPVDGASWSQPEGPGSDISERPEHPVVHVSWNDAMAYAAWSGATLPSEAQWEFAARGGHEGLRFPWGDELEPGGRHLCNVWQGRFPGLNTAEDGHVGPAPVGSYPPNDYALYEMIGNVWEWCRDFHVVAYHQLTDPLNPFYREDTGRRSLRGGSFLCHHSYCERYRNAARYGNAPLTTSSNIGFRVVSESRS